MYFFIDEEEFIPPFYCFFLCGTSYKKKAKDDKRNVLAEHIEKKSKYKTLILEKNFGFIDTIPLLNYQTIGLNNLRDIEKLTAFTADGIIIVHESIATAAELGMFAADKIVEKKICTLVPNNFSVDEDKISKYLKLAFWKKDTELLYPVIEYYPVTKVEYISSQVRKVLTYFKDNQIYDSLSEKVYNFCESCEKKVNLSLKKCKNQVYEYSSYNIIDDRVYIVLTKEYIYYHLIALFSSDTFRNYINKAQQNCKDVIKQIKVKFEQILIDTINEKEASSYEKFSIKIRFFEFVTYEQAIYYCMYMLHALDFINLSNQDDHFAIKDGFKKQYVQFKDLLCERKKVPLGEK